MTNTLKLSLLAAAFALLAGSALASHTTTVYFDKSGKRVAVDSGGTLEVLSGGTVTLDAGSAFDTHGPTVSTALTGNPLTQTTSGVITLANVNAGATILNSVSGRTIYPGDFTVMASGSAAGATGVYLRCGGSNNVIASIPVAMLTNGTPVGPFKSAGAGGPILASALTQGCAVGDSVYVSTTGTLTTTTHLYYSLPYTVQ